MLDRDGYTWLPPQTLCRFVVLAYSRSLTHTVEFPCLVAIRHDSPSDELHGQIEVLRSADWGPVPKEIQKYLLDLADDWRQTPFEETEALVQRLELLSIGVLRACKSGQCNRADLESAIREVGIAQWIALE
jgi:hypothetical protein